MGTTVACFQGRGSSPASIDLLKIIAKGQAISAAVSLRTRGWISSGPADFPDFRLDTSLKTSSSVKEKLVRRVAVCVEAGVGMSDVFS